MPSETTVDGIAVGGMSLEEATVTLQRVLSLKASRPIHMEAVARTVDIDPGTAGLEVDLEATLSDLTGFTLNPAQMWMHLSRGKDRPLKVAVDRAKLTAAVTEAARAVDSPAKEGSITFTGGRATAVMSLPGRAVDVAGTTDAVASAWPRHQAVRAVVKLTAPKLSPAEISRATKEFAVPAMSGPVKVMAGRASVKLSPAQFASALSLAPDGRGALRPTIGAPQLLAAVRAACPGIERTPVNATVRLVAGSLKVMPAITGRRLDEMTAPGHFLAALTSRTRTARLRMRVVQPDVTTAMARGWLTTDGDPQLSESAHRGSSTRGGC
jgi:hypothetical protein